MVVEPPASIPPVAVIVSTDVDAPASLPALQHNKLIIDMVRHYGCTPFPRKEVGGEAAFCNDIFEWVDRNLPSVDVEDMTAFHDESYVRYLSLREVASGDDEHVLSFSGCSNIRGTPSKRFASRRCSAPLPPFVLFPQNGDKRFNLVGDSAPFSGMWRFTQAVVSGTLAATRLLAQPSRFAAIHWMGGKHNAKRASAGGSCLVNDVVLAVLELRKLLPANRNVVLAVDPDAHHGDGAQEAFLSDPRVVTLSLHAYGIGIFPGTGSLEEIGSGLGRGYTMNIPLPVGATDALVVPMAQRGIYSAFRRAGVELGAVVVVCGSNSLSGDPYGLLNLTIGGYQRILRTLLTEAASHSAKVLMLGGSCNVEVAAARLAGVLTRDVFSCATALRNGDTSYFSWSPDLSTEKGVEVPEDCEYFTMYGPSFLMHSLPLAVVDEVHHFPPDSVLFSRMRQIAAKGERNSQMRDRAARKTVIEDDEEEESESEEEDTDEEEETESEGDENTSSQEGTDEEVVIDEDEETNGEGDEDTSSQEGNDEEEDTDETVLTDHVREGFPCLKERICGSLSEGQ
uniref:Histone deacetylase-like protein HDO2 n=1 Tax=Trypanosoma brucei TaxID=5691 RepID=Q8T6T5_9TRYP|nr:histone deacetylase-like protein HDO2 [Trypanosoma brucei]